MTVERGALDQEKEVSVDAGTVLPAEENMEGEGQTDSLVRGRSYSNRISNGHLAVQDATQLPSPSPSPRSSSPSLVVTDASAEYTGTLSNITHEHRYSGSFEKAFGSSLPGEKDEAALASPLPIPKTLPPHELHDIPEEKVRKPRKLSAAKANGEVLKLSAAEMEDLMSAPESLPVTSPAKLPSPVHSSLSLAPAIDRRNSDVSPSHTESQFERPRKISAPDSIAPTPEGLGDRRARAETTSNFTARRPGASSRAISSPISSNHVQASHTKISSGQTSPKRKPVGSGSRPEHLDLSHVSTRTMGKPSGADLPSPIPQSIPLPPMSIPTYLQLELSSTRPSPLYIYRSAASEFPYESSKVKFERLLNFLLLPPQLEQVLYFGTLACLDAWLYTFTILPLRFFKAAWILVQWWGQVLNREARFILGFIYHGTGRMWHRSRGRRGSMDSVARSRSASRTSRPSASTAPSYISQPGRTLDIPASNGLVQNGNIEHLKAEIERKTKHGWGRRHRRTKSQPSSLSSYHKADLLQDASRMYHSIRGQAAIKLYVIFNVLEVFDKLLAALGQDILECLFSNETLERDIDGRSKILRPMGMFILALIYNVVHAAALFYQVITLNVAVNSYSNALLTLLMSNQFVEIKSTVFKKIEKDNLFQLTCADIVERFQLWLMLMIIALRNIVEVGGLSMLGGGADGDLMRDPTAPSRSNSIMPNSFTILPSWSGEVLSPFLLVLGSEMLVDWIKHAYTAKFNNVKPAVYNRYLDVLAKDYYTNAFVNQNLIKRLGLPVIPLSCLFIRSAFQTYHMFLATHLPPPINIPPNSSASSSTSLSVESSSPSTTAALEHFDTIIRRALGRSTFGFGSGTSTPGDGNGIWWLPNTDSILAALTMLVFFLGLFLVLLALKLVLGMLLLKFARNRYKSMKKREHASQNSPQPQSQSQSQSSQTQVQAQSKPEKGPEKESYNTEGRRLGSWGMAETDDDKKRWIYEDDKETLRVLKEKEAKWREKSDRMGIQEFGKISRYEMVKRIW
ncbi:hypothetical protein EG329_011332 [Mollisiaceae sp. DMI_Dod_QoI]|nr:hypothetical protein EG329_011332 [Helotiales sp. DMI_Dod_QoI]